MTGNLGFIARNFVHQTLNSTSLLQSLMNRCRIIYYTVSLKSGGIYRTGMDGSNPVLIVTGVNNPIGITIDFENSRLYWMAAGVSQIQSSNMQGADIQTIVELPVAAPTWGIALSGDRIYSTTWSNKSLYSCTKSGQDVRLLYKGTEYFYQVAAIPRLNLPTNRENHCAKQMCSGVCVLSPTSFTCLS